MEISNVSIQALVKEIKDKILLEIDPYSLVSPSAYDTAWLAMIPEDSNQLSLSSPMFQDCLKWVLHNQTEDGHWGNSDAHGNLTMDSIPATLACLVALKKWNVGKENIQKGLAFIQANAGKLLEGNDQNQFPRWFAIVFPGMIERAHNVGLELGFSSQLKGLLMDVFFQRQQIFETEGVVDDPNHPLLSYLEVLPSTYGITEEYVNMHLSDDGSLFQSPSATARAFMATGNKECLAYLQSLVGRFIDGAPPTYPMDEELIMLGLCNQLQRLGLAQHFTKEIENILTQIYRNYSKQEASRKLNGCHSLATQLHKDSLAFRILREHGYDISPGNFCWFLNNPGFQHHIEKSHEYFSSIMLSVYRATDFMFPEEYELEEARAFSRKMLEKVLQERSGDHETLIKSSNLQRMIEHELNLPWVARLDHLEHRAWIENNNMNTLCAGKTSFHRFSRLKNEKLVQLAVADYEYRQSIYKKEMTELKSWCLKWGLSDMGFGREKTMYCYFAISASLSLPYDSDVRMAVAKSGILITVADDFFDMEGSLSELNILTDAVKRWDAEGLFGHSKTIFAALDDIVKETAAKHLQQHGTDITSYLQQIWSETFDAWLVEAKWSRNGHFPSMEEYLGTAMKSVGAHTMLLPASCLFKTTLPSSKLSNGAEYDTVTKSVMLISRLLNDVQSYQKEMEDGKMNFVALCMKENMEADIDDSIALVRDLLDKKMKELFKHSLMDGLSDLSIESKRLHLSCMKVFQMFYNSSNRFDSNTDMLQDIQKAIYVPLHVGKPKPRPPLIPDHNPYEFGVKKRFQTITSSQFVLPRKYYHSKKIVGYQAKSSRGYVNTLMVPKLGLSFA